jgi:hypothetical protein
LDSHFFPCVASLLGSSGGGNGGRIRTTKIQIDVLWKFMFPGLHVTLRLM